MGAMEFAEDLHKKTFTVLSRGIRHYGENIIFGYAQLKRKYKYVLEAL